MVNTFENGFVLKYNFRSNVIPDEVTISIFKAIDSQQSYVSGNDINWLHAHFLT